MAFLLDANVLIALGDSDHVHHDRVINWFHSADRPFAWASCPLTENAFLRIIGSPSYPAPVGDSGALRPLLSHMCAWPGHQFWPDDLSLRDLAVFPQLPGSKHLTDIYLLALAVSHQGKLATLDQRIDPSLISGGAASYFLIPYS